MELNTWISDSIFFIIPAAYRNTRDFMINEQGNIINLESSISFTLPEISLAMGDSIKKINPDTQGKKTSVYMKADTIIPRSVPDTVFDIPKGYSLKKSDPSNENISVDKMTVTESVDEPPPPPPPAKRKPKKNSTLKTKPHNP